MLAAATLPMLKLRDQRKKEMVKGILAAECLKPHPGPVQQPAMALPPTPPNSSSSKVQDFFCFEENDDVFSSVESEIIAYLRMAETGKFGTVSKEEQALRPKL
ncbi:hypothetical protein ABVT39_009254 [Epinephelus coioides]